MVVAAASGQRAQFVIRERNKTLKLGGIRTLGWGGGEVGMLCIYTIPTNVVQIRECVRCE